MRKIDIVKCNFVLAKYIPKRERPDINASVLKIDGQQQDVCMYVYLNSL